MLPRLAKTVMPNLHSHAFIRVFIFITEAPTDSSDSTCANAPDPSDPAQPLTPPPPLECPLQNTHPPRVENMSIPPHRHSFHGRRQQVGFRGGRRDRGKREGGRGGPAAHVIPPPVLESLGKLSVSAAKSSRNNGEPEDLSKYRDGHLAEVKDQLGQALLDESGKTSHQETKPEPHVLSHDTQTGARKQGARHEREKGRRYGPRGPPYSHWHERNAQWDNGGNVHHHHLRGATGHRTGHYRGNGKSWYQRTESELRKEGVL